MSANATSDNEKALHELELAKFRLGLVKLVFDFLKWVVVVVGAIVSFFVIDYGKLRLENFRAESENQRQLLQAYLTVTETAQPDIWRRKLHLIKSAAKDDNTIKWTTNELEYINDYNEKNTLYRETLKIASRLVAPELLDNKERKEARLRFEQLYWADLPYVREHPTVANAMVAFRKQLLETEGAEKNSAKWEELNKKLLYLSKILRDATPKYPSGSGNVK